MATIWTKETIAVLQWINDNALLGGFLTTEAGDGLITEDGDNMAQEGYLTPYGKVSIEDSEWEPFGPLLYLATEGYEENLLAEGSLIYLMYAMGGAWTEEEAEENEWTKVTFD